MKDYSDFTNEDYQYLFKAIAENTYIFDDIQFNVNCVKQQLGAFLRDGNDNVSSTSYHMAKVINLLTYLYSSRNNRKKLSGNDFE